MELGPGDGQAPRNDEGGITEVDEPDLPALLDSPAVAESAPAGSPPEAERRERLLVTRTRPPTCGSRRSSTV